MRYHCRCRYCRTRRVLPKHPEHYDRLPPCRVCGKRQHRPKGKKLPMPIFRLDKWMNERDTKATACTCGGSGVYVNPRWGNFPHRRGSLFCWYRVDGSDRYPGDPDFRHPEMELAA